MTASLGDTTESLQHESLTHGRTTVASRALNNLISAVTADTFEVSARAVHVDLSDRNGLLAVTVRTPVRAHSLERVQQTPALVEKSGGSIIQRAANAQTSIRDRVTELTGAAIAHVTVELTSIDVRQEGRVI